MEGYKKEDKGEGMNTVKKGSEGGRKIGHWMQKDSIGLAPSPSRRALSCSLCPARGTPSRSSLSKLKL